MLAYWCLWRYPGEAGATPEELAAMMDLYLERYAEVPLLCQPADALAELVRLGAAEAAGGRFKALPPAAAAARLSSPVG